CKRSAIRARSGTIPSSSSSKTVRRYISVVSISPCAVKTPLPWLCARFPWLCVRRTLTADTAGLSQHWPGRRDSRRSKWGTGRRLQGHGSDHRYRKHSVQKSKRFSRRSHDVNTSGARKSLGRKDRGRSLSRSSCRARQQLVREPGGRSATYRPVARGTGNGHAFDQYHLARTRPPPAPTENHPSRRVGGSARPGPTPRRTRGGVDPAPPVP